jgi:hypothetical protein
MLGDLLMKPNVYMACMWAIRVSIISRLFSYTYNTNVYIGPVSVLVIRVSQEKYPNNLMPTWVLCRFIYKKIYSYTHTLFSFFFSFFIRRFRYTNETDIRRNAGIRLLSYFSEIPKDTQMIRLNTWGIKAIS